jgi:hypothetical protein
MENNMKESKFIGALMPSHPDFQLIIQEIREKYQIPEVVIVLTTSAIKTRDWHIPVFCSGSA